MTCCNACFEVQLGLKSPELVQGHTFCGVATMAQLAAYEAGERPIFTNNQWHAVSAIPVCIEYDSDRNPIQVWTVNNREVRLKTIL